MNNISFNILPSQESNDHQVRILIDNEDLLGYDYLGIDPPVFFGQDNFEKNGELMIGRCTCGCEGCCDYPVTVFISENTISWKDNNGLNLLFDKTDYNNLIRNAKNSHDWEDIKRKVERLTTSILRHTQTIDKYIFDWASARIKEQAITISYSRNGDQKLFSIVWDGETETDIGTTARLFLRNTLECH